MGSDAVLRTSMVWLAAAVSITGLYTLSWKKMGITYLFGMLAICGVVLPDWDNFDRGVSWWCTVVTADGMARATPATTTRFKLYPIKLVLYTAVYGFAFYKWWSFVTSGQLWKTKQILSYCCTNNYCLMQSVIIIKNTICSRK